MNSEYDIEHELGYGSDLEEYPYFLEGAEEPSSQHVIETINRTLQFQIINANAPATIATATLFDANTTPLVQPANVFVLFVNIDGTDSSLLPPLTNGHEVIRNEVRDNPIAIQGLKAFADTPAQFNQIATVFQRSPQGKRITYNWQPQNYVSPTNFSGTIVDASDFGASIDGRFGITIPIIGNSTVTVLMTMKVDVERAQWLFGKDIRQRAIARRPTGNPLADLATKDALL